jgi:hypothetical protein
VKAGGLHFTGGLSGASVTDRSVDGFGNLKDFHAKGEGSEVREDDASPEGPFITLSAVQYHSILMRYA